jgi:hypothetical protein
MAIFFGYIAIQIIAPLFGNMNLLDTTYRFDKAIIAMPDGSVIKGNIENWADYEGDIVQVKINGKTYITQYSNVVMISE